MPLLAQGRVSTGPEAQKALYMKFYHNNLPNSTKKPWFTQLLIETLYELVNKGENKKVNNLYRLLLWTPSGQALLVG